MTEEMLIRNDCERCGRNHVKNYDDIFTNMCQRCTKYELEKNTMKPDKEKCVYCGEDFYLTKNTHTDDLEMRILDGTCNKCIEKKIDKSSYKYKPENSEINHPKHYNMFRFEAIDVIEDWQLNFHLGNCIKYISRAKFKGSYLADLKKAKWYLEREIVNSQIEKKPVSETVSQKK